MKLLTPCLLTLLLHTVTQAIFRDVTPPNFHPPALKFGGPAIADLDGNGYPDLLLGYHGSAPVEVYFNFEGHFFRSSFAARGDMHAYVPFRASPTDKAMQFSVSRGGRQGTRPRSPVMFQVDPDSREILNITNHSGITVRRGRGRAAAYVDMSLDPVRSVPDVIYTNSDIRKCSACQGSQQHPFQNIGDGQFSPILLEALSDSRNAQVTVVDIDGDGIMEIILFLPGLEIYKTIAPYEVVNITRDVMPESASDLFNVKAIAELDYDNDGDFDLYIAIGKTGRRGDLGRGARRNDILLENRGGVFVDVSESAGIPMRTFSFGVTAADFDNDGFMDIFLTLYDEEDLLLRNNRDGTFTVEEGTIPRPANTRGDMAQAVDYDGDGTVDLVVSQGERVDETLLGEYRIFKNFLSGRVRREGFVLVRVGSSPNRKAVSLHAVVTVRAGRKIWVRRVGSPGTAISPSYIELVHVGIGRSGVVDVSVRWVNGEEETVEGVLRGSKIEIGQFPLSREERRARRARRERRRRRLGIGRMVGFAAIDDE